MCLAIDSTVCFLAKTGPCKPTVTRPQAGVELPPFWIEQNALTVSVFAGLKKLPDQRALQPGHQQRRWNRSREKRERVEGAVPSQCGIAIVRTWARSWLTAASREARSDAVSRFLNIRNLPIPFACARWGCLATFPQWPRLMRLIYEHRMRLSQRIRPSWGVVFDAWRRGERARQGRRQLSLKPALACYLSLLRAGSSAVVVAFVKARRGLRRRLVSRATSTGAAQCQQAFSVPTGAKSVSNGAQAVPIGAARHHRVAPRPCFAVFAAPRDLAIALSATPLGGVAHLCYCLGASGLRRASSCLQRLFACPTT